MRKAPDAILLSHAHLDHTGLLGHADSSIPVYTSRGTSKMMFAGEIFSMQVGLPREQHHEIKPEEPVKIGDFTVTAFSVDHSIFGCLAFLVEADGKSILYTGDLRLHGRKTGMAKQLIKYCEDSKTGSKIVVAEYAYTSNLAFTSIDVTRVTVKSQFAYLQKAILS